MADPMQYSEALALAQTAVAGEARRTKVLANGRTDTFCTYLTGYARAGGVALDVEHPTYASLFAEAAQGGEYAVAWVGVEDVFPELSFRSASPWTGPSIAAALAERDTRIAAFCDRLAGALGNRWERVIVVPPFLPPPSLTGARANTVTLESAVVDGLRYALCARFADNDGVEVLDVVRVLNGDVLTARDLRMAYRTGNAVSVEASRRIAEAACRLLAPRETLKKCLITDLDDTLWRGVIGEGEGGAVSAADAPDSHHHHMFAKFLGLLKSEGVIIALVSKNNPGDVERYLGDPDWTARIGLGLTLGDFSARSISWDRKSDQISAVCEALNILPSACVFVDNDPYELAEVARALPEVTGIQFGAQSHFDSTLSAIRSCFPRRAATVEDSLRAQSYAARSKAAELSGQHDSVESFLADLCLEASFSIADATEVRPRELINKTNQFTLSGARYSREQWAELLTAGHICVTGSLRDRFSDHGTVLVAVLRPEHDHIDLRELVLSCRVFNRGLETAFLDWTLSRFAEGAGRATAALVDTGRNKPARTFLETHGFEAMGGGDASPSAWQRNAAEADPLPRHFVQIAEGSP